MRRVKRKRLSASYKSLAIRMVTFLTRSVPLSNRARTFAAMITDGWDDDAMGL